MKKYITIIICMLVVSIGFAQVRTNGTTASNINNQSPFLDASSAIFNNSANSGKGIVFPRTNLTTFTFNPANGNFFNYPTGFDGFIVYNVATGTTPVSGSGIGGQDVKPGFYYFSNPGSTGSTANGEWKILGGEAEPSITVEVDCDTNGFSSQYISGVDATGSTYSVTFINNSFSNIDIEFLPSDITFSGDSAADISVTAVSPSGVQTLTAGQQLLVTYTLAGTPNTLGTLGVDWQKLNLTCGTTNAIGAYADNFDVICGNFNGDYISDFAFTAANTIEVTLTNTSGPDGTTLNFATSDISLSGTSASGITVSGVSPTSATVNNGETQVVTYTLSGTPASSGTLQANYAMSGLSCDSTTNVSAFADNFDATCGNFNGDYVSDFAFTASNTIEVTLANTSGPDGSTLNFATSDISLSGTAASGITISGVSPANATLNNGENQVVTYTLSGTPTSSGTLQANYAMSGLSCDNTTNVSAFADNFDATCGNFNGRYINGEAFTAGNTIEVTLTNTSGPDGSTLNFATSNISLSGTAASGITVSAVSPASATLNTGESTTVTYTLGGTPASTGSLQADFSLNSVTCSNTVNITSGGANFTLPQEHIVVSIQEGSTIIQGVIDNASNQITIDIPYTDGVGSYDAFTGTPVSATGNADTNGLSVSYSAGSFASSGSLSVTIVVDGDTSFDVALQAAGQTASIATLPVAVNGNIVGNIELIAIGGIPDREFGNGNGHDFVYLEVTNPITGKTWLNNNLGANYANVNHASFNPTQQATSINDANAYGSLYQWGRYSDGHEFRNSSTVSGQTSDTTPDHPNFITTADGYNWLNTTNNSLWTADGGINNPCPVGYRIPTSSEVSAEMSSWASSNNTGALAGILKFVSAGVREHNGQLAFLGSRGYIHSASPYFSYFYVGYFHGSVAEVSNSGSRGRGRSVRCIKQ